MTWDDIERENLVKLILEVIELSRRIDLSPLIWQNTMTAVCRELTSLLLQNNDKVATKLIHKLQLLRTLMLNEMKKYPLKPTLTTIDKIRQSAVYAIPAIMTIASIAVAASTENLGEVLRVAAYIAMNVGVITFSHHLIRIVARKLRLSGISGAMVEALANVVMNAIFMNYINNALGVNHVHVEEPGFDFQDWMDKFEEMISAETYEISAAIGKDLAKTIASDVYIQAREAVGLPGYVYESSDFTNPTNSTLFENMLMQRNVPTEWAYQVVARNIYLTLLPVSRTIYQTLSPEQGKAKQLLLPDQEDPIKLLSGLFQLQREIETDLK